MPKKTIGDLPKDLSGKKVLVRLDLNVAIDAARFGKPAQAIVTPVKAGAR